MPVIYTIEKALIDYLVAALAPVEVGAELPVNPPEKYVVLEKTGGGEKNKIENATIAVQSYAASLYAASQLNEQVKNALRNINISSVFGVSLNSDYNYTDTASKQYRYQAIFDVYYNFI